MLARSPAYPARRSHSQPCSPLLPADIIGHPIAARNFRTPRPSAAPRFCGRPWSHAFVAARGPVLSWPPVALCSRSRLRSPPFPHPSATSSSCNRPRSSAPSRPPAAPRSRSCPQPRAFEAACRLVARQTLADPPPALLHRALRPLPLRRVLAESPPYRRFLAEPLPSSPRSVSGKLHLFARYA